MECFEAVTSLADLEDNNLSGIGIHSLHVWQNLVKPSGPRFFFARMLFIPALIVLLFSYLFRLCRCSLSNTGVYISYFLQCSQKQLEERKFCFGLKV